MAAHRGRSRGSNPDVHMSKALSYLCRHGATKEGITIHDGGFLFVDEILQQRQFSRYSVADVERVVANNDKQRFALQVHQTTGRLQIRANQGHTIEVEGLDLKPITLADVERFPTVVHGTYMDAWQFIKSQGLSRMSRNHIHFAPGVPRQEGVISGMRSSCQMDTSFFQSANNVILCQGNKEGFLPTKYFNQVIQLRPTRMQLPFDQ